MELEHCSKGGHDLPIETTNYRLKTTPKKEWQILVEGKHQLAENDMGHNRQLKQIDEYMDLEQVRVAKLIKAEVIAVVLYTSPMVCVSTFS
jgi:hypothetical protein